MGNKFVNDTDKRPYLDKPYSPGSRIKHFQQIVDISGFPETLFFCRIYSIYSDMLDDLSLQPFQSLELRVKLFYRIHVFGDFELLLFS